MVRAGVGAGCLLIGVTSNQNITEEGSILQSKSAYKRIYPKIAQAIENGKKVSINYIDFDSVV